MKTFKSIIELGIAHSIILVLAVVTIGSCIALRPIGMFIEYLSKKK